MIDPKRINENNKLNEINQIDFGIKEFDLFEILRSCKRKWKIFSSTIIITTSLGIFYVNYKSPVWEGQFQIVIAKKNNSPALLNSVSSNLIPSQSFFQSFLSGNDIDTELEILESPSVLKPVFEFVKKEKARKGIDISKLKFRKWKKDHFEIKKIKRTPVLLVKYFDEEKDLINPTLVNISKTYQNYSGRDRSESIKNLLLYLENQVEIYQKKNQLSFSNLQSFALQNNLPYSASELTQSVLEESRLVEAFNIDSYTKQLELLNSNFSNDSKTLIYIGGLYKELSKLGLPSKLQEIDIKISSLKSILKEEDPILKRKIKERELLFKELLFSTKGFLKAKLFESKAKYNASDRPQDILITYSDLLRKFRNDTKTLDALNKQKNTFSLEKARSQKPWELITPVTVLDVPESPRKLRSIAISIFLGGVFGMFFAAYADYRSGLIYEMSYFKNNFKYKLLRHIFLQSESSINQTLQLLKKGPLKINQKESIGLIIPDEYKSEFLNDFIKQFKIVFKDFSYKVSSNIIETENCNKRIVVFSPGLVTRERLKSLEEEISLQNKNLEGWIYLD